MSREYSKVSPRLWQSGRFSTLPSDDAKLAFLYLLTSEHQNSAGCYRLPDGYATADLRWTLDRYRKARDQLVKAGMIRFDQNESVVMIERWVRHNPPMSEDHLIGIERILERIDSDEIREAALEALSESWDAVQAQRQSKSRKNQSLASGPANGSGEHIADRLRNTAYMTKEAR
jgi:hypothetical protein